MPPVAPCCSSNVTRPYERVFVQGQCCRVRNSSSPCCAPPTLGLEEMLAHIHHFQLEELGVLQRFLWGGGSQSSTSWAICTFSGGYGGWRRTSYVLPQVYWAHMIGPLSQMWTMNDVRGCTVNQKCNGCQSSLGILEKGVLRGVASLHSGNGLLCPSLSLPTAGAAVDSHISPHLLASPSLSASCASLETQKCRTRDSGYNLLIAEYILGLFFFILALVFIHSFDFKM